MREQCWARSAKSGDMVAPYEDSNAAVMCNVANQIEELRLRSCKARYPQRAIMTDKSPHKLRLVRWEAPQGEEWFAHATLMDVDRSSAIRLSYVQVATELSTVQPGWDQDSRHTGRSSALWKAYMLGRFAGSFFRAVILSLGLAKTW
jgi:hypothetical protein